MAKIDDLIKQIQDDTLREQIQEEVDKLSQNKKFGLVFENHLPECTPLYGVPIKKGAIVSVKNGSIDELYRVKDIRDGQVVCICEEDGQEAFFAIEDLVTTARFGEPIYPYLEYVDSVSNAPDSDLWHTLIEADNYHALQLLEYLYAGKVDCIYIDPPYNTGARDWKYNNDYVDSSDSYRHSKWLSMMEKRLKLAKKLLNPQDSVLICTIDEKEYLHLGCLLEELFPEARMQMVSSVINPAGTGRANEFSRVDEYIFFIMQEETTIFRSEDDMLFPSEEKRSSRIRGGLSWESFLRSGKSNIRGQKENSLCYPILIDESNLTVIECLDPLIGENPDTPKFINGKRAIYPFKNDNSLGIWRLTASSFMELYNKGYAYVSSYSVKNDRYSLKYLLSGTVSRIESGDIKVKRDGNRGQVTSTIKYTSKTMPKTVWNMSTHNAGKSGSDIVSKILINRGFPYPKSLYAVRDTIRFFVANKPNALIVDFFAGSGTTLHAVNLLNAEDSGHRRCIMVTNNEVSEREAKSLSKQGYQPGDKEWETLGIARYVTWPRTVCSIEGHDIEGKPLKGNYLESDIPMADGFQTNAIYFKLGFLDKTSVALGLQFKKLLSVLWMKAGSIGSCPELEGDRIPNMLILPDNHFAVLIDEKDFSIFLVLVKEHPQIETVFIVTDSESGYREMAAKLRVKATYQLYRDYLDNFRINTGRI